MPAGEKRRSRLPVAAALACGSTVAAAAVAGGVSESCVAKWLRTPVFRARVRRIQTEAVGRAVGLLSEAMAEAALALRELLLSDSESVRLRAATAILTAGLNVVEVRDLAERVAALEEQGATP